MLFRIAFTMMLAFLIVFNTGCSDNVSLVETDGDAEENTDGDLPDSDEETIGDSDREDELLEQPESCFPCDGEMDEDPYESAENKELTDADGDADTEAERDLVESTDKDEDADHDEDKEDLEPPAPVEISNLFVIENPGNALSYYVEWNTDVPASTYLKVDCGADYQQVFSNECCRMAHSVFVMGLFDGAHCTFTVKASAPAMGTGEYQESADIGPLPDFLPELLATTIDADSVQAGWTLFNLSDHEHTVPIILAMVDRLGRYRWYYRHTISWPGHDTDVRTVPEGVLFGGGGLNPRIIDWEGRVIWSLNKSIHHHIMPYGDEGHLMFLTFESGCNNVFGNLKADVINEWDRDSNSSVWRWYICEYHMPPRIMADWSHMNTVEAFPNENALLFSSRNQNTIMKMDRDSGDIIWKIGEVGNMLLSREDHFFQQHAPEILENGNILLYDNGRTDKNGFIYNEGWYRTYSRAIELEYTYWGENPPDGDLEVGDKVGEAHVVWEYNPVPLIFTPLYGDADRLPNGNTLVTFGMGYYGDDQTSYLHEVTATHPAVKVWDLRSAFSFYRAERVINPPKGFVIEPPTK